MLLNVENYQTLTPTRAVDAANNQREPIAPIDGVVFVEPAQAVLTERGKRFVQNGVLRVRKNEDGTAPDLQPGDEITVPEGVFGIVGGPQMNRLHSLNGSDFGWLRYSIRKGG